MFKTSKGMKIAGYVFMGLIGALGSILCHAASDEELSAAIHKKVKENQANK